MMQTCGNGTTFPWEREGLLEEKGSLKLRHRHSTVCHKRTEALQFSMGPAFLPLSSLMELVLADPLLILHC